jgi:hypothetical protein
MSVFHYSTENISLVSWVWIDQADVLVTTVKPLPTPSPKPTFDVLRSLRQWLDSIEVRNPKLAHRLCKLIPAQCPFERDVKFFGHTLFHIPPLCKLNPLYEEVVALRFRGLCYLADECGEDVTAYC